MFSAVGDGLIGVKSYGMLVEVRDHDVEWNTGFSLIDACASEAFVSIV